VNLIAKPFSMEELAAKVRATLDEYAETETDP
jgi:DNA-binding response OmpR family regulator